MHPSLVYVSSHLSVLSCPVPKRMVCVRASRVRLVMRSRKSSRSTPQRQHKRRSITTGRRKESKDRGKDEDETMSDVQCTAIDASDHIRPADRKPRCDFIHLIRLLCVRFPLRSSSWPHAFQQVMIHPRRVRRSFLCSKNCSRV